MSILEYIDENWIVLLVSLASLVMIWGTVHINRRRSVIFTVIIILVLVLSVAQYVETYLGRAENFTMATIWGRRILTAVKYVIMPMLVALVLLSFGNRKKWNFIVFIPAILDAILCTVSIFTPIVFGFKADINAFFRGTLGYLPFYITGLYVLLCMVNMIKMGSFTFGDILPVAFLTFSTVLAIIVPLILNAQFEKWVCSTIAVSVLVYFVFIIQQLTKRDPLTNLYNRQSYYYDMERLDRKITSVISLDMNGLKEENDTKGHSAGDLALSSLATAFKKAVTIGDRIYRVGGDEFMIFITTLDSTPVERLVARIRENIKESGYSCAVGYAKRKEGESLEETILVSDERMYEEKRKYYEEKEKVTVDE